MGEPKLIQSRLSPLRLRDCPGHLRSAGPRRELECQKLALKGHTTRAHPVIIQQHFQMQQIQWEWLSQQEASKEKNSGFEIGGLVYLSMKCQPSIPLLHLRFCRLGLVPGSNVVYWYQDVYIMYNIMLYIHTMYIMMQYQNEKKFKFANKCVFMTI